MTNKEKLKLIQDKEVKRGRPKKYENRFNHMAEEIMALGATVKQLAVILQVTESTIYEWTKEFSEFSESIQRGRDDWDSENVEKALKKRAMGFKFTEKTYEKPQVTIIPGKDKAATAELEAQIDMMQPVLTKSVTKYIPPSDQALQFWLKNRRPKRWPKNGDLSDAAGVVLYSDTAIKALLDKEKEEDLDNPE